MTIDELAGMIKGEFDNIGGEIKGIKSDMANGFKELKGGHEKLELKMSNVAYRFEVDDLKNQLNQQRELVEELRAKNTLIKLAKSLNDTNEKSSDVKLKINQLVREIDKCVSLLSNK